MPIAGDRPPRLGGDVDTVENLREVLVVYSEYQQQMCIPNGDGCGPVLARSRELVDSTTPMMVTGEIHNGNRWVDLSEEELLQGVRQFASVGT